MCYQVCFIVGLVKLSCVLNSQLLITQVGSRRDVSRQDVCRQNDIPLPIFNLTIYVFPRSAISMNLSKVGNCQEQDSNSSAFDIALDLVPYNKLLMVLNYDCSMISYSGHSIRGFKQCLSLSAISFCSAIMTFIMVTLSIITLSMKFWKWLTASYFKLGNLCFSSFGDFNDPFQRRKLCQATVVHLI